MRRLSLRWFTEIVVALIGWSVIPTRLRGPLLSVVGFNVRGARFASGVVLDGRNISIGTDSFIGVRCYLEASVAHLCIGQRCFIGTGSRVLTATHRQGPSFCRAGERLHFATTIEDGCWLGAGVTVLPGVTVGRGCIIGAGALLDRDTEPNGLYVGVPARWKRDLA
jgi:maltose O-acetyltransferase